MYVVSVLCEWSGFFSLIYYHFVVCAVVEVCFAWKLDDFCIITVACTL